MQSATNGYLTDFFEYWVPILCLAERKPEISKLSMIYHVQQLVKDLVMWIYLTFFFFSHLSLLLQLNPTTSCSPWKKILVYSLLKSFSFFFILKYPVTKAYVRNIFQFTDSLLASWAGKVNSSLKILLQISTTCHALYLLLMT